MAVIGNEEKVIFILINSEKMKVYDIVKDEENEASNTKYEIDFNKLKQINNDTVAWIKVNNTNIQCPIVKTNNK